MNFFTKRNADLTACSSLKGQRKKVLLPAKQLTNYDFLYLEGHGHCLHFASSAVSLCRLKTRQLNFWKPPLLFVNTLTNANEERKTQNRIKQIRGKISGQLET